MARKHRLEYAGAIYHVINRGNYRQNVFEPEGAAEAFERCLNEACVRFGWRLHAYVIMRNHFHLAVETPEPNLSLGMKFLQGTWANRFNRYRGLVGRPFQGRYKALHDEPGTALAQVANYIHLNPVRAKVVDATHAGEYRWSSLWWFTRSAERPAWLRCETVLSLAGSLADAPEGWQRYCAYLGALDEAAPKRRGQRFGKLSRGWAIGTEDFKRGLIGALRQRGIMPEDVIPEGGTESARQALRESVWEVCLHECARVANIDLTALGPRKSAPAKVQLAAAIKAGTAVSNGWLCERLGMGTAASVSQFVRRWLANSKNADKTAKLAAHLSKIKT